MKEFEGLKVPEGDILEAIKQGMISASTCTRFLNCTDIRCKDCICNNPIKLAKYIACCLTPIDELYVPFGMLSEEKQNELHNSWNKEKLTSTTNIQYFSTEGWLARPISWSQQSTYRKDPNWKPEPEVSQEEIDIALETLKRAGKIVDGKIIKG